MMRLTDSTVYYGPNLLTDGPVIRLRLHMGALQAMSTDRLDPLIDGIVALFPALASDLDAEGRPGGMLNAFRLPPGQPASRLVARVALELQRWADADVHVWGDFPTKDLATRDAVFAYEEEDFGLRAGRVALEIVTALLPDHLHPIGEPPKATPAEMRDRLLDSAQRNKLDQTTRAIVNAANRRGIPWFRLSPSGRLVQIGQGHRQHRLQETLTDHVSALAYHVSHDKTMTNQLLQRNGVPVPKLLPAADADQAVRAAEHIGFPVVLKPALGKKGEGVELRLTDGAAVRAAFERTAQIGMPVVVESFVPGDDHRLLVVDGKMIAAARRIPGAVIGDGQRSIEELIDAANEDPRRGHDYEKLMNRLAWDQQAEDLLAERGFTRTTIPAEGDVVFLRRTANISTGGTAVDVSDAIHPDNRRVAEHAARLTGLPIAGVDFLSPDISRSFREVPSGVCEVNASPGLRPHWIANPQRDVVNPVLDTLMRDDPQGRIPIAAITGTNGKTTTAVMLSRIMREAGYIVGQATSDAATVDDNLVVRGEVSGVNGAHTILRDPRVELAVLEVARRGLLLRGVGFDQCDVAAVTNIDNDHVGLDGVDSLDDMARVKQVVARLARDTLVLNADDPRCRAMAGDSPARHICLVTMAPQHANLTDHLLAGGRAVWMDNAGQLLLHDGHRVVQVMAARDIPATLSGLVSHNISNALFAIGMASALGASVDHIRTALAGFAPTADVNPGRLNIFDGHPFRVVIDHAHNPPGAASMRRVAEQMAPVGRRHLAFYSQGNRTDRQLGELAKAVAGGFDSYLCYQPGDLRGRPEGEVNDLIRAGLLNAGVSADAISTWGSEADAVAAALERAQAGDLLMLFSDDYAATLRQVSSASPAGSADAPMEDETAD